MCVGPILGGYLYAWIGFFWLCTLLSGLFLCFIPLAYFFIGDSRALIERNRLNAIDTVKDMEKSSLYTHDA